MNRFFSYLRLELRNLFARPRWLLPIPLVLFIAYRSTNGVRVLSTSYGVSDNGWDALLYALSSADVVYFVLSTLFLYLLADLAFEPAYGQWALLRLGSRRSWWWSKCLSVLLATLGYVALVMATLVAFISLRMTWQGQWSEMIVPSMHFIELGLTKEVMSSSPVVIAIQHVALLTLGWLAFGLLVTTVTLLTQRALAGFLSGAVVLLSGYFGIYVAGREPAEFPYTLLIHNHLEYTPGPYPLRTTSVTFSILYWVVWILILVGVGYVASQRQDLLASDRQN